MPDLNITGAINSMFHGNNAAYPPKSAISPSNQIQPAGASGSSTAPQTADADQPTPLGTNPDTGRPTLMTPD